jgi:hypothetical protein
MELKVEDDEWKWYKNRGSPRTQTYQAQAEIKKQVDILIKNKIIRKSNAIHYSQVVLASKPNGKWRMCIDYKMQKIIMDGLYLTLSNYFKE